MCTLKCISAQKSGTVLGKTFFHFFQFSTIIFLIFLKNIFGKIRENWKNMGKLGKCWKKIGKEWENVFPKIVPVKVATIFKLSIFNFQAKRSFFVGAAQI